MIPLVDDRAILCLYPLETGGFGKTALRPYSVAVTQPLHLGFFLAIVSE